MFLAGCGADKVYLSNEEIIEQANYCKENDFDFEYKHDGESYRRNVLKVVCVKKNKPIKSDRDICIEKGGVPIEAFFGSDLKGCEFKKE